MLYYRICERKNNELFTLFHGVNKSRKLVMNEWLEANIKDVTDGSKKTSKIYKSGFHVLPSLEETREFAKKFRAPRDLVIVECEIGKECWKKEHSPANIILAKHMKINKIVESIKLEKI